MEQKPLRKKIFIIHGFGVKDGIGWEAGGDLDTVSSNVFYTAWARSEIERIKGAPAVRGVDYDYDFVNYSEGLSHLVVHSGCDIYIPDFPIDALSPRLELMYIPDYEAVPLVKKFNSALFDLKIFMTKNSPTLDTRVKKIFNSVFKQKTKVLEHPEKEALIAGVACVDIISNLASLSSEITRRTKGGERLPESDLLEAVLAALQGEQLRTTKEYILELMGGFVKEEQMDELDNPRDILKIQDSSDKDFSARGRVNYTDDFTIISVESAGYASRNMKEIRLFKYSTQNKERIAASSSEIASSLSAFFKGVKMICDEFAAKNPASFARSAAQEISRAASSIIDTSSGIRSGVNPGSLSESGDSGKEERITVLLMEQASGRTVEDVRITIKKMLGGGRFRSLPGVAAEISADGSEAHIMTADDGSASIIYEKGADPSEDFQISATYDDVKYLMIPEEIIPAADSSVFDEALDAEDDDTRIDRAMEVSLKLLEKQFHFLAENDVKIASLTDHHPYTPIVHQTLSRLKDEGLIEELDIRSRPRGEEEPVEKQVCGANVVYTLRLANSPAKNEGLAELNKLARLQDLHIQTVPLAISLSKLIGSKFSKIEMVERLSEITTKKSLESIMSSTGWDKVVADYERRLSLVLPRSEANVMRMVFEKPPRGLMALITRILPSLGKKNRIDILAALSAFCDPRKGEPQINVASAIGHIIGALKKRADYFFYCYGSDILTQRKMSNSDERINLSTLSQSLGTKADGGHSGASTCKPISNPAFPRKRLSNVKENNFPEYLYYLGDKISSVIGYPFKSLEAEVFELKDDALLSNLAKLDSTLVEVVVKSGWMRKKIIFAKVPKPDYENRESNPSIVQMMSYLSSKYRFDYLFLIQGALSKMILANVGDRYGDIDLVPLARTFGWSEDSGDPRFAIASLRRNRQIPREWRFSRDEQFFELCVFMTKFLEEGLNSSDKSIKEKKMWKIHSILSPRITVVPKEFEKFADKFRSAVFESRFIMKDKKISPLPVAVVSEPYAEGIRAPSLQMCLGFLRRAISTELYRYIIYIRYSTIYIINTSDDRRIIDVSSAARGLDPNYKNGSPLFAALDKKSVAFAPGYEKMTRDNAVMYVTKILEKISSSVGCGIDKVERKSV